MLMEYLKRASPEFVAAELQGLGLLQAADAAAERTLGRLDSLEGDVEAERFEQQIAAVLEQHGVRLAEQVPPSGWRRCAAGLRRAVPAAALCALLGTVLALDPRWVALFSDAPVRPPQAVRERIYKEYIVRENPVADGVRQGVDGAALRRLRRGMRERGIDAARLNIGAPVALEYEILLEPATGAARFAGLISASVAGRDLQFAEYAPGEGLRVKEGL